MLLATRTPEDLRRMVLEIAQASAGEPERAARAARWFHGALRIVEAPAPAAREHMTTAAGTAVRDLNTLLVMALEHAELLADITALPR